MRRSIVPKLLAFVLPFILIRASTARADDWDTGRDALFDHLATAIEGDFPLLGYDPQNPISNARASVDWCFADQADPITNWWYFNYCKFNDHKDFSKQNNSIFNHDDQCGANNNDGYYKYVLKPYSSDAGVRLKLLYQYYNGYYTAPASVFFAVDLLKTSDYANETLVHALNEENSTPIGTTARSSILFPNDNCSSLKDFLKVMFPSYIPDWKPAVDPTCATVPCGQTDITGTGGADKIMVDNIQIGLASKDNPIYWRFNDRTHTISGAMRIVIKFRPCSDDNVKKNTCGPYDGKYGLLWIGFGGSGGAG
jgi:hypothetical protein